MSDPTTGPVPGPMPPAGWFPDPQVPGQQRYWDGTRWTEHRAPGASPTGQQLNRAGQEVAEGVASAFTAAGTWFQANVTQSVLTFEQVAARCQDEAPREPLSHQVQATVNAEHVDAVRRVFAEASTPITAAGAEVRVPCRLVPNPWNPADPRAVAVLVGPHLVGRLPEDDAAAYGPALVALTQHQLLVTGTATLTASWDGTTVSAGVGLALPEAAAIS